jgi:FMN-dependent NADH-azoreductase
VPMYNLSVPGIFKNYADRVVIKGKTFAFGPDGFTGLLANKKAFVLRAAGTTYDSSPMKELDFHEPYLRALLGFIGITDITYVHASGHSQEEIAASMSAAKAKIQNLCAAAPLVRA